MTVIAYMRLSTTYRMEMANFGSEVSGVWQAEADGDLTPGTAGAALV